MRLIGRSAAALLLLAASIEARVISYSPYTDRASVPAVQSRLNRHFVLLEQTSPSNFFPPNVSPPLPGPSFSVGQVVLYDSRGAEEPRVVFPQDGSSAAIGAAAAREEAGSVSILIHTTANFNNTNPTFQAIWLMTSDSGATWRRVAMPTGVLTTQIIGADVGGAFVRSRYSNVRIGTREFPFAVALTASSPQAIYIVGADASVRPTFITGTMSNNALLGSDREGRQFLVRMNDRIVKVDVDGGQSTVVTMSATGNLEGWISPNGEAFIEHLQNTGQVVLFS